MSINYEHEVKIVKLVKLLQRTPIIYYYREVEDGPDMARALCDDASNVFKRVKLYVGCHPTGKIVPMIDFACEVPDNCELKVTLINPRQVSTNPFGVAVIAVDDVILKLPYSERE